MPQSALDKLRTLVESTTAEIGADNWTHPYPTYVPDPRKKQNVGAVDWFQDVVGLPGGEGYAAEGDDPIEREKVEAETWGIPFKIAQGDPVADAFKNDPIDDALSKLVALESILNPTMVSKPKDLNKSFGGFMIALMLDPEDVEKLKEASGNDDIEPGSHCTIAYCHNKDEFDLAVRVVEKFASTIDVPVLTTTKIGYFLNDAVVRYMGCAGPGLEAFVSQLRQALDAANIKHDEDFPIFIPHITLGYHAPREDGQPSIGYQELMNYVIRSGQNAPFTFLPRLAVVDGNTRVDFEASSTDLNEAAVDTVKKLKALQKKGQAGPARSTMEKHMVRAIYHSLQDKGKGAGESATGAFAIARSCMQNYGYATSGANVKLTGKGVARSKKHASEPAGTVASKQKEYDAISTIAGMSKKER
jgi:hypothetical protein